MAPLSSFRNETEISLFCDDDRQNLRKFLSVAWTEAHTAELGRGCVETWIPANLCEQSGDG